MTNTPIDRESVERLAQREQSENDYLLRQLGYAPRASKVSETLLALRAALDAAEAHKKLAVIAAQEAERERLAKVAETHVDAEYSYGPDFDAGWEAAAFAIAAAIRAQGET